MSTATRYQSGGWLGMVGNGLWLLTNAPADDQIVERSWNLIRDAAALHQLVAMFTERSDLTYALVGTVGDVTQVVVRGPVHAELATPTETAIFAGAAEGGDWSGHVVPGPVLSVTLIAAAATTGSHPPAPPMEWLRQPPTPPQPDPTPDLDGYAEPEPIPDPDPEPVLQGYAEPTPTSWATEATSVLPQVAPPVIEPAFIEPNVVTRPLVEPVVESPGVPHRVVSGLISDVSWADALADPMARSAAPAPAPPPPAIPIQAIPIQAAPIPETPAFAPTPVAFGDTTTRQDLDVTIWRPIAETSVMTGNNLTVSAVRCVDGHLNPLIATSCRVCAKTVPPQSSLIVPRPPLGILRMSTSDTIRLDHGVIFGRDPGTPDANRRDQPYFVKLTDPDISRRHLEVVLDGWDVTVVDLNSSNGSAITMPGGVAEVIPGGTWRLLVPGTIVHMSDTVSFVYEVTP